MNVLPALLRAGSAIILAANVLLGPAALAQESSDAPKPSSNRVVGRPVEAIQGSAWCLLRTRTGHLWIGSNGDGAFRYDGEQLVQFTREHGLAGDSLRGLQEDARGRVVLSTTEGVSLFDGNGFRTLPVVELPPGEGWELRTDDLWLVVDLGAGGPCRFDGETLFRLVLPKSPAEQAVRAARFGGGFPPDGVYTVHRDRRGHVWIGTSNVGLCRFDGENVSWMFEERLTTTPEGGAFGIRAIHEDRRGRLWITNTRQSFEVERESRREGGFGVLAYRRTAGMPESATDEAPNFAYYSSVVEDVESGVLWFASGDRGVWSFDGERVTRFALVSEAYAVSLAIDGNGWPWVGTLEHGVFVLEGKAFRPWRMSRTR